MKKNTKKTATRKVAKPVERVRDYSILGNDIEEIRDELAMKELLFGNVEARAKLPKGKK